MQIIDGKKTAESIKDEIAAQVESLVAAGYRRPKMVAVLVGNDGGSVTYVRNKELACRRVGFESEVLRFEDSVTEEFLLSEISRLNADDSVDGFIVQLPLPPHIDEDKVISAIDASKDIDGFHPVNVGRMMLGQDTVYPATPFGITVLLDRYGIETSGKHCVVVGRSNIVGRPVANMLSQKGRDCTVTVCHSRTRNIAEIIRTGDIVIAAMGSPRFITEDMVKEGAVVIDVGTTRIPCETAKNGYRLSGDVDFENVSRKCSWITPVPGGVGPMTIVSLMWNTLKVYRKRHGIL